ncbi:MAG: HD domain-containing protein [Actinobacteria bacterium]|nr:HD domain-containing protein [Actinomycetota bacterium]
MNKELKNEIIKKMITYFDYDNNHINHTYRVLDYAEEISDNEKGDPDIVIPSAILHDIGIPDCKKKYKSTGGQLQEIEGPMVAREILESLSINEEIIKEVCEIVGCHHSPGEIETMNFKIIWDADCLVNLPDFYDIKDKTKLAEIINKTFMTKSGLKKAREIYL